MRSSTVVAGLLSLSIASLPAFAAVEERAVENPYSGKPLNEVLAQLEAARLAEFTKNTGVESHTPGAIPPEVPINIINANLAALNSPHHHSHHQKRDEPNPYAGKSLPDVLALLEANRLAQFTKNTGVESHTPGAMPPEVPINVIDAKLDALNNPHHRSHRHRQKRDEPNPFAGKSLADVLALLEANRLAEFTKNTGVETHTPGAVPPEVPIKLRPVGFSGKKAKRQDETEDDTDVDIDVGTEVDTETEVDAAPIGDVFEQFEEDPLDVDDTVDVYKRGERVKRQDDTDVLDQDVEVDPLNVADTINVFKRQEEANPHAGKSYAQILEELVASRMAEFRKNTGFTPEDHWAAPPQDPSEHAHLRDGFHNELRKMRRVRRTSNKEDA